MPSLLTRNYQTDISTELLTKMIWTEMIENLHANSEIVGNAYTTLLASANATIVYATVGRPQEWSSTTNTAVTDSLPPIPVDTVQTTAFDCWRSMLGAKRLFAANTHHVIPRVNWTANTVYDQYDDLVPLANLTYYVLDITVEPYRVYKCLWNNLGAPSTASPSDTLGDVPDATATGDGYVWQYMYSLSSTTDKFLTTNWMPVYTNAVVQNNAVLFAGQIPTAAPLTILASGANYDYAVPVDRGDITVTITGDGTGATSHRENAVITGGTLTALNLVAGGLGYTQVTSINVYQAGASSATVRAIIPPYPNHGWDPIHELGAHHLMTVIHLVGSEADKLSIDNDFRQVGVLINPEVLDANDVPIPATANFYRQTCDLTLSSNTMAFIADDIITNISKTPTPTGIVVDAVLDTNSNVVIRTTAINRAGSTIPFAAADAIKCDNTDAEGIILSVSSPELRLYSGQLVYLNNRTPVTRQGEFTETIKIIFPF